MSLSTVVSDFRRSVADSVASASTPSTTSSTPDTQAPPPTSTPRAAVSDAVASASDSASADSFFPEDDMNRGFAWRGRSEVAEDRAVWRLSGEMYARDFGGVQVTGRGVAAEGGPGGVALESHSWRAQTSLGEYDAHRIDVGSGGAAFGVVNGDGSVGMHLNASANVVAYEGSYDRGGFRVSGGASFGAGGGGSVGLRDADGDGRIEICSSIGVGPVSVGACYEPYTVAETAWNLANDAGDAMRRMVSSMRP